MFFDQGFSSTSIDMIIDRIGGSKRSIYKEFGSKEMLFTALVTELADEALAALHETKGDQRHDLRTELLKFARELLEIYTSKPLIGVYRVIITEARRFPGLARSIYEKGPGRAADELKAVLDSAYARGEIRSIDTAAAAGNFIGMLRDNLHLQIALGLREPPDTQELQQRANWSVDLFLNGVAVNSPVGGC